MIIHRVHPYLNTHVGTLETPESRSWWAKADEQINTYVVSDNIANGYEWIIRLRLVLGDLRRMQFGSKQSSRY